MIGEGKTLGELRRKSFAFRVRVITITSLLGIFSGFGQLWAQNGALVLAPRPVSAPTLDVAVIEGREKNADRKWLADHAGDADKKNPSIAWLSEKAVAGNLQAAILMADAQRKSAVSASPSVPAPTLAALFDKGMMAGDAKAFVAKAELDWNSGDFESAAQHLKEASRRGSARADFRLAVLKAGKPDWGNVQENPLELLARAADRGDRDAALQLGLGLKEGLWRFDAGRAIKCPISATLAVAWMQRASLLGSEEATFWLGLDHMRRAKGLVDPLRQKAVEYLLTVRRCGADLKEPETGQTFSELEALGMIEPGLLGELKRREAQEEAVVARNHAERNSASMQKKNVSSGAPVRSHIDHALLEIVGDPDGSGPVWNFIGLSPYREIAGEGELAALRGKQVVLTDNLPDKLPDPAAWCIDLVADGRVVYSAPITALDPATKSVWMAETVPENLPRVLQYRLVRNHTLWSTFGRDNRFGLKPGTEAASADRVLVFEAHTFARRTVFFHADLRTWMDSETGAAVAADFDLAPGAGLGVRRGESGALIFQARGMLPAREFDFSPRSQVGIVSMRKNALSKKAPMSPGALSKASDLAVLTNKNGRWAAGEKNTQSEWWRALGFRSSDRINVPSGSAAVLVNN